MVKKIKFSNSYSQQPSNSERKRVFSFHSINFQLFQKKKEKKNDINYKTHRIRYLN